MEATITAIDWNGSGISKAGKRYTFTGLSVSTEKGDRQYKLFGGSPLLPTLKGLNVGDAVELRFDTSGQFPELVSIEKRAANTPSGGGGGNSNKDESIAKAVALKASVDLQPEGTDVGTIIETAEVFEAYLLGRLADMGEAALRDVDDEVPF